MVVDGDPRQRGLRLPLRPGADAHDILGRQVADLGVANLHARRDPQIAEPLGGFGVVDDPAADEGDAAIELRRQVHQDLHPVDREANIETTILPGALGKDLLERVSDVDLGAGEALTVDVGAVGEEREDASRAELRQAMDVIGSPSIGVWSILKSPVWITTPAAW